MKVHPPKNSEIIVYKVGVLLLNYLNRFDGSYGFLTPALNSFVPKGLLM